MAMRYLVLGAVCVVAAVVITPSESVAQATRELLTAEEIKAFSPRARDDLVAILIEKQRYLAEGGIENPIRLVHFFAQIATETGGLQRLDENMNYSAERLRQVFGARISDSVAQDLEGKPKDTANFIYGGRLGNRGRDTDDGWNYRGSGFLQITGRDNFRRRGHEVDLPLEDEPELARQPDEGLSAAVAYWVARKINSAADTDDLLQVRKIVNGARAHGLAASRIWFERAWEVWGVHGASRRGVAELSMPTGGERGLWDALEELGFLEKPSDSTIRGREARPVSEALKDYQKSRGLPVTGVFDEDTLYAITDPREWRHRGRQD
jgi:predicted chitinase